MAKVTIVLQDDGEHGSMDVQFDPPLPSDPNETLTSAQVAGLALIEALGDQGQNAQWRGVDGQPLGE